MSVGGAVEYLKLLRGLDPQVQRVLLEGFVAGYRDAVNGRPAQEPARPAPVTLSDGTVGYSMGRNDDCLQTAIATCLQVPVRDVPAPELWGRVQAGENVEAISRHARGGPSTNGARRVVCGWSFTSPRRGILTAGLG